MQPIHFNPPEELAPYIAFYGIIDVEENFSETYCSPPLGLCGFQLNFIGKSYARLNGELFLKDRYCATGQITSPMIGELKGRMKSLLVFIHPCGLYQLFGFDMSLLTNTSIPLQNFLGQKEWDELYSKLTSAETDAALVDVMNTFFLSQLPVFELAPKIQETLNYIHQKKGTVSIKDIEANCYITPRSLERHFKICIGLSPKEYAKIFRFKCLVNYFNQNPGINWSTLCEQNGYYDQSHLTRYFSRYMKMKPTEMARLDKEFIDFLLQDTV